MKKQEEVPSGASFCLEWVVHVRLVVPGINMQKKRVPEIALSFFVLRIRIIEHP